MRPKYTVLVIIFLVLALATIGLWYRVNYFMATPAKIGEVILISAGGNTIGRNGTATTPEVGATTYFDGKVTKVRLGISKRVEATYELTKPDGSIKELERNFVVRGLKFEIEYYLPSNRVIVNGEYLDQPGSYRLTGRAQGYNIQPINFTVASGVVSQAASELFLSKNIGDYSLVGSKLVLNFGDGEMGGQEYEAGYSLPDSPRVRNLAETDRQVVIDVLNQKSVAKTSFLSELERKKAAKESYTVKDSVIKYQSNGTVYAWYSKTYIVKIVRATTFEDSNTDSTSGNNQILLEAYLKRYPPESL